jgi:hypothetical protein
LPNGLGVVSVMAVLLSLIWLRLATSRFTQIREPYLFVRRMPYAIVIITFDHGGRRSI